MDDFIADSSSLVGGAKNGQSLEKAGIPPFYQKNSQRTISKPDQRSTNYRSPYSWPDPDFNFHRVDRAPFYLVYLLVAFKIAILAVSHHNQCIRYVNLCGSLFISRPD